jgi:hypothetical protein
MNSYDIGDVIRLRANFQDSSPADVDPSQVKCSVQSPWGVTSVYVYGTDAELIKTSTGDYYLDTAPNKHGVWKYRWEGLLTNRAAEEGQFFVRDSAFD